MSIKDYLINRLLHNPLEFSDYEFQLLLDAKTGLSFVDLRVMITRIFNINETILADESTGSKGLMGEFNSYVTAKRQKKYYKKIKKGFRAVEGNKIIVAEGDSWFQYPLCIVRDIIDHLSKQKNYLIYNIAYAGDWLTNIIQEGKYVEQLSIHKPDVFLISGGGNDLVGSNRIAALTTLRNTDMIKQISPGESSYNDVSPEETQQINNGLMYITKDFHALMLTLKAQYYLVFRSIKHSAELKDMMILTQGYDYPIPSSKNHFTIFNFPSWYVSRQFTGEWLDIPLKINGIVDPEIQKNILKAMIYEFNKVFIYIASDPDFKNVYHIDCRGVSEGKFENWFDEIHLKSHKFRIVADLYRQVIEKFSDVKKRDGTEKIFSVVKMN